MKRENILRFLGTLQQYGDVYYSEDSWAFRIKVVLKDSKKFHQFKIPYDYFIDDTMTDTLIKQYTDILKGEPNHEGAG